MRFLRAGSSLCGLSVSHLCAELLQSCPTLCNSMDCNLPGSSVRGILQARILEWVARPSSRGSSQPRDCFDLVFHYVSCIAGGFFTTRATWEAPTPIYKEEDKGIAWVEPRRAPNLSHPYGGERNQDQRGAGLVEVHGFGSKFMGRQCRSPSWAALPTSTP